PRATLCSERPTATPITNPMPTPAPIPPFKGLLRAERPAMPRCYVPKFRARIRPPTRSPAPNTPGRSSTTEVDDHRNAEFAAFSPESVRILLGPPPERSRGRSRDLRYRLTHPQQLCVDVAAGHIQHHMVHTGRSGGRADIGVAPEM